jgi:hypothetical protein
MNFLIGCIRIERRIAYDDGCGYGEPDAIINAIDYAKHRSHSHDAVIRVYDAAGNMIETHEHTGEFKEP